MICLSSAGSLAQGQAYICVSTRAQRTEDVHQQQRIAQYFRGPSMNAELLSTQTPD